MGEWIECADFIEADVICFHDAVWERRGPQGRQKATRIGSREVTAEVIDTYRDGNTIWVVLKIVQSIITNDTTGGRLVHPLKVGEEVKRLRTSLVRWGKPRRLLWSDEDNRSARAAERTPVLNERKRKSR